MGRQFGNFANLADTLQLYSQSLEGLADGCNEFQTQKHKKTKMKAIRGFQEALDQVSLKDDRREELQSDMLSRAKVDQNGNSHQGSLSIEEVKANVNKVGQVLKINSMYHNESDFSMKKPPITEARGLYEDCVNSAAKKPKEVTVLPEQQEMLLDDKVDDKISKD